MVKDGRFLHRRDDEAQLKPLVYFLITSLAGGGAERSLANVLRTIYQSNVFTPVLVVKSFSGPNTAGLGGVLAHELRSRIALFALPLSKLIRKERPKVIISHVWEMNFASSIAKALSGSKHIVVLCEHSGLQSMGYFGNLVRSLSNLFADEVVYISEAQMNEFTAALLIPPRAARVIRNPVLSFDDGAPQREKLPNHPWLASKQGKVYIAAGRFVPVKRFDVLVDALAHMPPSVRPRLIIYGDGPLRQRLFESVAARGLDEHISLPGYVENYTQDLMHADALLMSSETEGLPNVMVEAAAFGLPILTTPSTGAIQELQSLGAHIVVVNAPSREGLSLEFAKWIRTGFEQDGRVQLFQSNVFSKELAAEKWTQAIQHWLSLGEHRHI